MKTSHPSRPLTKDGANSNKNNVATSPNCSNFKYKVMYKISLISYVRGIYMEETNKSAKKTTF